MKKRTKYSVGLVEEMIMNYDALPPAMKGLRRYRIEYGGHAEFCDMECTIYVPPGFDGHTLEKALNQRRELK